MRRPLGRWFTALPCVVACATGGSPPAPGREAAPGAPAAAATPPVPAALPPLPCAGIGSETSQLGHPISPPPGTGIRSLDEVSIIAKPLEVVWTSELPQRPVDWVLRTRAGYAHSLWALRRVEGGWCVIGSFVSSEPVKSPLAMSDRALVGTTAVALLRFESLPDQVTGITTRYVALATDGDRLWLPLEGKGGQQLIAREVRFRKQGSTLFLDVSTPGGATAVLGFDGTRFMKRR